MKFLSIVLLGTLKNYGQAGSLALSFFDNIYIIWLEFKK